MIISKSTKRRKPAIYTRDGKHFNGNPQHWKQVVTLIETNGKKKNGKTMYRSFTEHLPDSR